MLKKTVTYKSLFTGEEITEEFYFHMLKTEILELEVNTEGGLEAALATISKTKDNKEIWDLLKKFVLLSYGKRVGAEFIKSDADRNAFQSSPAFEALVMGILESDTPEDDLAEFFNGIMPKDMLEEAEKLAKTNGTEPPKELAVVEETLPEKPEFYTMTRAELLDLDAQAFARAQEDISRGALKIAE